MFVVFSRNVGDQPCPGIRLILATGVMDAASQSRFYAALLMALATGTQVTLSVSACYGNYPAMSASDWWFVPQEVENDLVVQCDRSFSKESFQRIRSSDLLRSAEHCNFPNR